MIDIERKKKGTEIKKILQNIVLSTYRGVTCVRKNLNAQKQ